MTQTSASRRRRITRVTAVVCFDPTFGVSVCVTRQLTRAAAAVHREHTHGVDADFELAHVLESFGEILDGDGRLDFLDGVRIQALERGRVLLKRLADASLRGRGGVCSSRTPGAGPAESMSGGP